MKIIFLTSIEVVPGIWTGYKIHPKEGITMAKRKYSAEFKAKVAIEAIKEDKTISEIVFKYGLYS